MTSIGLVCDNAIRDKVLTSREKYDGGLTESRRGSISPVLARLILGMIMMYRRYGSLAGYSSPQSWSSTDHRKATANGQVKTM